MAKNRKAGPYPPGGGARLAQQKDYFKLSYKDKTRESLTLGVYNCGAQKCTGAYSWGEGVRDHYLIHYVVSGKGYYRARDTLYSLGQGDLFIVYPGHTVKYWADEVDPWEYDWVGFAGSEARFLIGRTDFSPQQPVLHYEDKRIPQSLAAIIEARGSRLCDQTRMIGRLYEFLALLLELSRGADRPEDGFDYVGSAVRYIAYNYSAGIDVSQIAREIGVSRSHLYRVFMQNLGVTPNEYLTRYRIEKACELLGGHRLPIGSVASSVGYEDPLYFSRVFKRLMGLSPRDYQKGHAGQANTT